MNRLRRVLGVALAVAITFVSGALIAPAHASTPGAGFAYMRLRYGPPDFPSTPVVIDSLTLHGVVVASGKAANITVTIGPFTGDDYPCSSPDSCGWSGPTMEFTGTAQVSGAIGDGSGVGGVCQGGTLNVGGVVGSVFDTTCTFVIRHASTGPFHLEVSSPQGLVQPVTGGLNDPTSLAGAFCTDAPAPCGVVGDVNNPFPL